MRTINAFLVIMMTILGFTNSFDFASLREIQSLKQNSFASSLIETISLSLTSSKGEGVEDVIKMLGDLRNQLNGDQKTDDDTFSAKNAEFDAHIKKLSEEIATLTAEIAALQARIEQLEKLIAQAEINIRSFEDRIGNLTQTLVDLAQKLEDDTTYYTKKANGLADLNAKLLIVNEKLAKLIGSASGVQVFDHIEKTESEKRDIAFREEAAKAAQTSFIQLSKSLPIAPELLQLTLQADQKALQRLMQIITKFANQALDEKAEAEKKLQEAKETYEILKKSMEEEIELNKQAKAKQEENKRSYESEKAAKETEKAEKEARKEALEKEKAINEKLQNSLRQTYEKEKRDRAEETRVVGILMNIVEKRLMK